MPLRRARQDRPRGAEGSRAEVRWADSYPILRFTEVPEVAARIVDASGQAEEGAGEIAQGPVAGAIGNAVADAVGYASATCRFTRDRVARAIDES